MFVLSTEQTLKKAQLYLTETLLTADLTLLFINSLIYLYNMKA